MSKNFFKLRYTIYNFSACGYGNIGDYAIMLGTARYLITRKKAKDLVVFNYTRREIQQALEVRTDRSCYDIFWIFLWFGEDYAIK